MINSKVIANFVKCAKVCKFVTQQQEQQQEQQEEDKPQFYSFRYIYTLHFRLYLHKTDSDDDVCWFGFWICGQVEGGWWIADMMKYRDKSSLV